MLAHYKVWLTDSFSMHGGAGAIMLLEQYCPWKSMLYELEEAKGIQGKILFVVYEDETEHKWRVQAVNKSPASFELRKGLPAPWRGLRGAELDAVMGFPGGVFVHISGFIGGHATKEGALRMATTALDSAE
jgi:uncharacterized UPF0160 family protein